MVMINPDFLHILEDAKRVFQHVVEKRMQKSV